MVARKASLLSSIMPQQASSPQPRAKETVAARGPQNRLALGGIQPQEEGPSRTFKELPGWRKHIRDRLQQSKFVLDQDLESLLWPGPVPGARDILNQDEALPS